MKNELVNYISQHTSLSEELTNIIKEISNLKTFKKGTLLLKEGEFSNENFLVLSGCVRSYIIKNGEEKTIEFYTEGQPVATTNYGKKIPSEHYLECVEDTIVNVNTPEYEAEMFEKYPQFESICRIMSEVLLDNYQATFINYKMTTPEDRYINMLAKRPDLVQRVPQYQIASYLGITPESLSRLRKRILSKQE